MFSAFASIDGRALCGALRKPVLLIPGEQGKEDQALLEHSRAAEPWMPPGSALEIILGADHGMRAHWDEVLGLAVPWLSAQLGLGRR